MIAPFLLPTLVLALVPPRTPAGPVVAAAFRVSPGAVQLRTPESTEQLVVRTPDADVTRKVVYRSSDPAVVRVSASGLLEPGRDGAAEVVVTLGKAVQRVPVRVSGVQAPRPISFEHEVVPLLTKAGCNSGGCHGKAEGQNGFKLSLFGFEPEVDFRALVQDVRGRRVMAEHPEESLLVRKAAALIPHGGGRRIAPNSLPYRRLVRWIREGLRERVDGFAALTRLEVDPPQRRVNARSGVQLRVVAVDEAGGRRDVTAECEFQSNATAIAESDSDGWINTTAVPGEAAILVRYRGLVGVSRLTVPQTGVTFRRPAERGFVDRLVWDRLQRLGVPASGPVDDAGFLRRVFLDTIGTLPTPSEARAFLQRCQVERAAGRDTRAVRGELIDSLLARPEYADYWALRWSDVLRVDRDAITANGAVAITRWLRRQFAENRPYDQLAWEILTASGPISSEGPAAFYRALEKPEVISRSISQLVLGVRIECAQCHHHPSERWSQEDYFALAGYFTGVSFKNLPGGGQAVVSSGGTDLKHPKTGQPVAPRPLAAPASNFTGISDRRLALADWVTAPENPFFARALANRLWAHYLGRGLVEPIDDMRATNPPTNEALLDALAAHLREQKYDLKAFTRTLLNSAVYQLSADPLPANKADQQNYSHMTPKALPAEVLLDAISQSTGVPEKFIGWPLGYRAIQVWDNRMQSYFFRIFGRPVRASVCECERSNEPSISQALHLMNSPEVSDRLRDRQGTAHRLAASNLLPDQIIEELFLGTVSRYPSAAELKQMRTLFAEGDRQAATEDVLWALLNSKEFVYSR